MTCAYHYNSQTDIHTNRERNKSIGIGEILQICLKKRMYEKLRVVDCQTDLEATIMPELKLEQAVTAIKIDIIQANGPRVFKAKL